MRREYKSGSSFALWRWKDVVQDGELYLRRLHLIQTPWFSIFVHWIPRPDRDEFLHDHPVTFLSIVLKGWYFEVRESSQRMVRWFNFVHATDAHRIIYVHPTGAITLVFSGPPQRVWGFHTYKGWVSWRDYYAAKDAA